MTEALFNQAADAIKIHKALVEKLSDEVKEEIYGLFKQAKEGDNTKPAPASSIEKKKWEVWMKKKGISKENAMKAYIELAKKVLPKDAAAKIA